MQSSIKKMIFFIIAIVLVGWAWYVNQNKSPDNYQGSKLDKVLERMEKVAALKSSVLGNISIPYTLEEIRDYEDVYQNEVDARLSRLDTMRENLRNDIRGLIPSSIATSEVDNLLAKAQLPSYKADVTSVLASSVFNSLSETIKTQIKAKTDLIGAYSGEKRAILVFKDIWSADRQKVCTTDDAENDIYKKGSMSLTYMNTTRDDVCEWSNIKQYTCANNIYQETNVQPNTNPKVTLCPFGCSEGACKKGQMGAINLLDAENGNVITSRQKDQSFWVKLSPAKDANSNNVKVDITSTESFRGNKCTLSTKSINVVTSGAPITFGPIRCTTTETHTFALNLKVGTTITETQTITMPYGSIEMDHFNVEVLKANKIGVGTPVDIKVSAIGSTGLPYTTYNEVFDVIVTGDEEADYDRKAYRLNNGTLTVKGIKFSKAGTFKILIASINGTKTITGEADVTVQSSPTASLEASIGTSTDKVSDTVSLTRGEKVTIYWTSGSFASATSSVTATPTSCSKTWINFSTTTFGGSSEFELPSNIANNCSWTVKYTVKNSLNETTFDTLIINGPTS